MIAFTAGMLDAMGVSARGFLPRMVSMWDM